MGANGNNILIFSFTSSVIIADVLKINMIHVPIYSPIHFQNSVVNHLQLIQNKVLQLIFKPKIKLSTYFILNQLKIVHNTALKIDGL